MSTSCVRRFSNSLTITTEISRTTNALAETPDTVGVRVRVQGVQTLRSSNKNGSSKDKHNIAAITW
eukprot:scaffold139_cov260-Ochromonas_danica.AAC.11